MKARPARAVRIHVPVLEDSLHALLAGNPAPVATDPVMSAMLRIIRADPALGDFGLYNGVAELTLGWETFAPGADARPTLGNAGAVTLSPTVTLTTWIAEGASQAEVDHAFSALLNAHPWEVPVIEVTETRLLQRG